MHRGLLYHVNRGKGHEIAQRRIVVPKSLQWKVLREFHDNSLSGHLASAKTTGRLKKWAYWTNMDEDILRWILSCPVCQRAKDPSRRNIGLHQPRFVNKIYSTIGADVLSGLPVTPDGYKYILVLMDLFNGYLALAPLKSKTAAETALRIISHWISHHGLFECLLIDGGREFCNRILTNLCNTLRIETM